jgi:hypothetical protein
VCLLLLGFGLACGDPKALLPETAPAAVAPADAASPSSAASPASVASPAPTSTATHRVLGILDPERDNMVAFALKVPIGWAASQSFSRHWEGAVSTPQITLRLEAPDKSARIEYRPLIQHIWPDGPMTQQLRAQKQQMGMDPRIAPNELEPMAASAYAQRVIVPRLGKEGIALTNLHGAQDAPEDRPSPQEINRRGSVDGTLADGSQARVECRMRLNTQEINGETFVSWSVVPSITQAKSDLEAAYANTRIAQDSIVPNPAWQKLEQEAQQRGAQANSEASRRQHEATMDNIQRNTDAMTAGHNQRMADIQAQGDANTARFDERMGAMDAAQGASQQQAASGDQQHEYRIDGIREESKYADPTTGETVKVQDGYDNVYRANNGTDLRNTTILATQAPLDPQQVDWQQLQKLTQQEY